MGRWTQYEEDSARLPTGMKRIGYDADTQRYKFQDEKGVLYESEPGSAYGTLRPIAERDIRKSRPNAFEPSTKTTSPGSPHTRSKSTTTGSNLRSFQDFLPSTAITSSPTPLSRESSQSSPSSDSRLPDVFSKVRSMTSAVSRLQLSHRPPEGGGRYQHIKSPSLPVFPLSAIRKSESSQSEPPPVPPKRSRGYTQMSRREDEDEMKKKLLRSKTSVTRSSAAAASSPSSALGSKRSSVHRSTTTASSVHRSATTASSSSSSRPSRRASQASRISSVSTTSTITPMKTT